MRTGVLSVALMVLAAAAASCRQASMERAAARQEEAGLVVPVSTTLHRGEGKIITVGVAHESFASPVTVTVSDLPEGVGADEKLKTVNTGIARFILTADAKAYYVNNWPAKITAVGKNGMRYSKSLLVTVEP